MVRDGAGFSRNQSDRDGPKTLPNSSEYNGMRFTERTFVTTYGCLEHSMFKTCNELWVHLKTDVYEEKT